MRVTKFLGAEFPCAFHRDRVDIAELMAQRIEHLRARPDLAFPAAWAAEFSWSELNVVQALGLEFRSFGLCSLGMVQLVKHCGTSYPCVLSAVTGLHNLGRLSLSASTSSYHRTVFSPGPAWIEFFVSSVPAVSLRAVSGAA